MVLSEELFHDTNKDINANIDGKTFRKYFFNAEIFETILIRFYFNVSRRAADVKITVKTQIKQSWQESDVNPSDFAYHLHTVAVWQVIND